MGTHQARGSVASIQPAAAGCKDLACETSLQAQGCLSRRVWALVYAANGIRTGGGKGSAPLFLRFGHGADTQGQALPLFPHTN